MGGQECCVVVEGEKCADSADAIGLLAVTSAGGSKAAAKTDWKPLASRSVVIIPDNDEPGRKYARQVAGILTKLDPPATVKLIDLADDWPELPDAGDVADWCDAHDAVESESLRNRLEALIERATNWTPATVATENRDRHSKPTRARCVKLQSFADIETKELRWLWPNRFPLGMLSLVSGNPAAGKSMLMADLIARVTTGTAWPDGGKDSPQRTPGDVILLNAEDSVSRCQKPRLEAAGADVGRVHRAHIEQAADNGEESHQCSVARLSFNLAHAAFDLRVVAKQLPELRLIVLDPLAAFLAGIRANDQGEIRAALSPLVELAEELDVAIVFVHHNRKGTGSHSSERLSGSLQIGATMRQIWEVTHDPDDKDRRLFVAGKNSNARDRGGLAFRVVDSTVPQSSEGGFAGRVQWEAGLLDMTADDVALQAADIENRDPWPMTWLREAIANGPRTARELSLAAKQDGISNDQLRRARERLKIVPRKSGFAEGWVWELPAA